MARHLAANRILFARREHGLPKFKVTKADRAAERELEVYDSWRAPADLPVAWGRASPP